MKFINFANGLSKPSFLFTNPELNLLLPVNSMFSCSKQNMRLVCNYERTLGQVMKCQCYAADRTRTFTSVDSKPDSARSGSKKGGSSSLYLRPSLHAMKKDMLANRTKLYEFLRGIGIVPDELDGLELPVSVEVMKERVDFLHNLGLTIEDINNYPLVLGCSVKKNMVPVLDYLGKLGVRRSSLTHFLQRYPQVLHSSVVVDLQPVVKYLKGLDIKPVDIPGVLERYPEVLGFKLEGTMSTSVAYLVAIGVGRREIGGVLTKYPEILGMRVGRVIKPFVDFLEELGIPKLATARLIEKRPHILGFGLKEKVKPNIECLEEFHVIKVSLPSIIAQYPEIIGLDLRSKIANQFNLLNSMLDISPEEFGKVVERMPQVVSLSPAPLMKHVRFLKDCGFSPEQMKMMVVGCPQLLALNLDIMELSFDYFQKEMERPLDDLVAFPAFFTYGLESTVKRRHRMVAKKGVKCSLSWMLNCSDERFEERMTYDTIDIDEMEVEPSFDMKSLMQPRYDDSGSDYEDSDYDDE